jgi:hypothetical protein
MRADETHTTNVFDPQYLPPDRRLRRIVALLARGLTRIREARLTEIANDFLNSADSSPTCLEQSADKLLTDTDG